MASHITWVVLLVGSVGVARAATINVAPGDVPGLIGAINTANGNGQDDIISLGAGSTYSLTAADNGANGLPVITSKITIQGNGATIRRTGAADFRLFELGAGADLTLDGVTASGGRVAGALDHGGGIEAMAAGAKLTFTNTTVSGNTAGGTGGGISMRGANQTFTMAGSTVSGNTAQDGGGIALEGNFYTGTITLSRITENMAVDSGSGTFPAGGGIALFGSSGMFMLIQSSVDHNAATSPTRGTEGGGVSEDGGLSEIHIIASTLSDNSSDGKGTGAIAGGFSDSGGSTVTFVNSTVTGNSATGASNGSGGGISQEGGGAMLLSNTTVTKNTADTHGGGIFSAGGTVTLQNSIVADNPGPTVSPDCAGPVGTNGYNLIGTTTGCTITPVATDVVGKSAKLAPLANNGGPTLTHALLPDSPAKDAGNPATPGSGGTACEATDQRGFPRPVFAACDVGAFELQPPPAKSKCTSKEISAAGKKAAAKAKCHAKAIAKNDASKLSACLMAAESKFSAAYGKAQKAGHCINTTSAMTIEGKVDGFINDLRSTLAGSASGPSKCTSKEIQAAGNKAGAKAKCHAKAVAKADTSKLAACLTAAESKFSAAYGKAQKAGDCINTTSAMTVEGKVDAFVNDVKSTLAP